MVKIKSLGHIFHFQSIVTKKPNFANISISIRTLILEEYNKSLEEKVATKKDTGEIVTALDRLTKTLKDWRTSNKLSLIKL